MTVERDVPKQIVEPFGDGKTIRACVGKKCSDMGDNEYAPVPRCPASKAPWSRAWVVPARLATTPETMESPAFLGDLCSTPRSQTPVEPLRLAIEAELRCRGVAVRRLPSP